jgi:3-deoxy-D-manno-octulosonic-acid transferase
VKGREDYFKHLPIVPDKKVVWFHCASLGEFDMALPVMNSLKDKYPSTFILVSFFSPSGMEHYHKRIHKVDLAVYLPSDSPANAQKFIAHFKPEKAFFVKYEFWSNYIFEAKKQDVQVFSLCSIFRDDHRFFKWYGGFFRDTLRQIDFFYTQNERSSLLLADIEITNFITAGDTRFDRVIENKKQLVPNEKIELFLKAEKAIILGSTWPKDEEILIPFILKNPTQKFIIAPHNIDEAHIVSIEQQLTGKTIRYTDESHSDSQVLILNTIGNLSNAYSYGKMAYIGGGFSGSLHNILEPAVFGLPVIFGPKFKRFPEASMFLHAGIGFTVNNLSEFENTFLEIDQNLSQLSEKTEAIVLKNTGASLKIIAHLESKFGL